MNTANANGTVNVLASGFTYRSGRSDRSNAIARSVIEGLKSGSFFQGTVRSHSAAESDNISWIAIELPLLEERQIMVRNQPNLRLGQQVFVECVPDPLKSERFKFQIARPPQ